MKAKDKGKKLNISLIGKGESSSPQIAIYHVRKGKPVKKLAKVVKEEVSLDMTWAKSARIVAFGPDVDDLEKLESEHLLTLRVEDLFLNGPFEIAQEWWDRWIFRKVCVSGKMKKCFPIIRPLNYESAGGHKILPVGIRSIDTGCCGTAGESAVLRNQPSLGLNSMGKLPWPRVCRPVCHGVVEVYEKCCNIEIPPIDICDIFPFHPDCMPIDLCDRYPGLCMDPCIRFPELCGGIPEIGPIDPIGPIVRPVVDPVDPIAGKILKKVRSKIDPVTMAKMALPPRVIGDIKAMMKMSSDQARDYFMERPHLYPIFFDCTTRKVGETMLAPDGSFTLCYLTGKKPCFRTTYAFKVKQWQNGGWVEVYNGLESNEYFTKDEAKVLYANFRADACENEPGPDYEKPYVMLQKIGLTDSFNLSSPVQQGQNGIGTLLPANAGLLNMSYAVDCPLSNSLSFSLKMSDAIYKSLNARFYRISYAPSDDNGNAVEDFTNLSATINWRKIVFVGGHFEVDHVRLGPNLPVNGEYGLYSIPDPDEEGWLDSVHGIWESKTEAGGKYVLKIEIFKENGTLIKPGPGADFVYLHWDSADSFTEVTRESLIHVLRTNHTDCMASIEDLRHNGESSSEDCQFITGQASDKISIGYRAYHDKDPLAGTFMMSFNLKWQRGFYGSLQPWDSGTDNQPPSRDAGVPAVSQPFTLTHMFGGGTSTKCTFMARLYVYAKHTNGSTRLNEYDDADFASFALEMID